jgi:predicted amidophosphoribosyltransferase
MSDRDLKLDSKYNIISRVVELEKRVTELENKLKRNDEICPKCQSIIKDKDGICWTCYINSNK